MKQSHLGDHDINNRGLYRNIYLELKFFLKNIEKIFIILMKKRGVNGKIK